MMEGMQPTEPWAQEHPLQPLGEEERAAQEPLVPRMGARWPQHQRPQRARVVEVVMEALVAQAALPGERKEPVLLQRSLVAAPSQRTCSMGLR